MKKIIKTNRAPAPIGPYSQGVQHGNMLFISGQVAKDALTGNLVVNDIKMETEKVMENIKAVLYEAGFEFEHIVKTTIFLTDMKWFAEVNAVYASYFKDNYPARETVAVLGLPLNVNVEITVTAIK